jgi:hypothetical protein
MTGRGVGQASHGVGGCQAVQQQHQAGGGQGGKELSGAVEGAGQRGHAGIRTLGTGVSTCQHMSVQVGTGFIHTTPTGNQYNHNRNSCDYI